MKKKIKDLTFEEIYLICRKHQCEKCPFQCFIYCPKLYKQDTINMVEIMAKEVEVDEIR